MKDKEMIEELAKDLHEELETENIPYYECDFMAQRLIKKGWIKPDKHSVVLSINEWINFNKDHANELIKAREEEYGLGYEKGCKETAEKILQEGGRNISRSFRDWIIEQFGVEIKED